MHEIARITLENEMDLILAHKRSMKLAELAGLSLSAQTTFATAVSEICRNPIESEKIAKLLLSVDNGKHDKYIVACLKEEHRNTDKSKEGLEYAKRLVNKYNVSTRGTETSIELFYYFSPAFRIDITKLDEWRTLFRNEPPVSPYDELKRRNEMLQDFSDKLAKSESQYKILTNSLPLVIFSLTPSGELFYTIMDFGTESGRQCVFAHSRPFDGPRPARMARCRQRLVESHARPRWGGHRTGWRLHPAVECSI